VIGAAVGAASWANEGAAKATAATAAAQASMRRMKLLQGRYTGRGAVRPQFMRKYYFIYVSYVKFLMF
jgi:hypothetical protein